MSVEAIQAQLLYDPFWQEIRDSVSPVSQGKGAPTASDLNRDAAEAQCSLRGRTTCTCYVDSCLEHKRKYQERGGETEDVRLQRALLTIILLFF